MDFETMMAMFYQHADTVGQGLLTYDDVDLDPNHRTGGNITYDHDKSSMNVYDITYDAERQ